MMEPWIRAVLDFERPLASQGLPPPQPRKKADPNLIARNKQHPEYLELKRLMKRHNLSASDMGRLLRRSERSVLGWLYGTRTPGPGTMLRLRNALWEKEFERVFSNKEN